MKRQKLFFSFFAVLLIITIVMITGCPVNKSGEGLPEDSNENGGITAVVEQGTLKFSVKWPEEAGTGDINRAIPAGTQSIFLTIVRKNETTSYATVLLTRSEESSITKEISLPTGDYELAALAFKTGVVSKLEEDLLGIGYLDGCDFITISDEKTTKAKIVINGLMGIFTDVSYALDSAFTNPDFSEWTSGDNIYVNIELPSGLVAKYIKSATGVNMSRNDSYYGIITFYDEFTYDRDFFYRYNYNSHDNGVWLDTNKVQLTLNGMKGGLVYFKFNIYLQKSYFGNQDLPVGIEMISESSQNLDLTGHLSVLIE